MQLAEPARPDQPVLPDGLRHVMIVDDIEITRQILERQLEQVGIKVTSCASGAEALERLSDDIDLVLTDHNMPQMDGLELCAALRSRGATVPTLLLSSSPAEARKDPNHQLLQGILQKPLPRENLLSQLKGLGFGGSAPVTLPVRRPLRLLAAEDNRTNQLVFRKMLKDLTLDLTFACDGEEAVQLYKACQPDLVFMDISMPRMDGKKATQAIRQIEKTSGGHVPIIALTAHAMNGDDAWILAAGLDHYMPKPLRKPLIIARIEEVWTPDMAPLHQPEDIQEAG
jgi:CheY-like chemotaxis protein